MPRRVRVEVTAEDIASGIRDHCEMCPIALAIRRATGLRVDVDIESVELYVGEKWRDACYPDGVSSFITDFDVGRPVSPFAFDLDVPDAA